MTMTMMTDADIEDAVILHGDAPSQLAGKADAVRRTSKWYESRVPAIPQGIVGRPAPGGAQSRKSKLTLFFSEDSGFGGGGGWSS